MRRSLNLRIAVFVALLGVLGSVATGCTWVFSFTFTWGHGGFFDEYVWEIYEEDAYGLGVFYADQVWLEQEGRSVSQNDIVQKWVTYFATYYIEVSNLIRSDEKFNDGEVAIVEVDRYEIRRHEITSCRERVTVCERYVLHKVYGKWRITSVSVKSESVHRL